MRGSLAARMPFSCLPNVDQSLAWRAQMCVLKNCWCGPVETRSTGPVATALLYGTLNTIIPCSVLYMTWLLLVLQLLLSYLMLWGRITIKSHLTGPLSSIGSQQLWTSVVTMSHTQWPATLTLLILTPPLPLPLLYCLHSTWTTLSVLIPLIPAEQPLVHRGVPRPLWGLRQKVRMLHHHGIVAP